jgi:hypothetical protein
MRTFDEKTEYVSLSCGCPAKAPAPFVAHRLKDYTKGIAVNSAVPFFIEPRALTRPHEWIG